MAQSPKAAVRLSLFMCFLGLENREWQRQPSLQEPHMRTASWQPFAFFLEVAQKTCSQTQQGHHPLLSRISLQLAEHYNSYRFNTQSFLLLSLHLVLYSGAE